MIPATLSIPTAPHNQGQLLVKIDGQQVGIATPNGDGSGWILWGLAIATPPQRFSNVLDLLRYAEKHFQP